MNIDLKKWFENNEDQITASEKLYFENETQ